MPTGEARTKRPSFEPTGGRSTPSRTRAWHILAYETATAQSTPIALLSRVSYLFLRTTGERRFVVYIGPGSQYRSSIEAAVNDRGRVRAAVRVTAEL